MRWVRFLVRRKNYPTLFLPIQRGPLHGFYHFFVGYLAPVYWEIAKDPHKKFAVVDATPLNHWYQLLPTNNLEIVDQAKAIKLSYLSRISGYARGYRVKPLIGWDKWLLFHKRNFAEISALMRKKLAELSGEVKTSQPKVLVLGREFTPTHYAEKLPTRYGTAKRNIPNLSEVVTHLAKSIDVELVDGAELAPLEMYVKCSHASVIVGQHGAALTNLFFMKPGASVIEIGWPDLANPNRYEMYRLLSEELGLRWQRPILQKDKFAEITPVELERIVSALLNEGGRGTDVESSNPKFLDSGSPRTR